MTYVIVRSCINMSFYRTFLLIIFIINIQQIICIWPPDFQVNLSHEEVFVIFDPIKRSEIEDVYEEDEMINKKDMERLNVQSHDDKYYRLHRNLDIKKNLYNVEDSGNEKKNKVFEEFNPDKEYSVPFKADFVNSEGDFVNDDDVIYFDEKAKLSSSQKRKRSDSTNSSKDNYDYVRLHSEYNKEVKNAIKSNNTLNYTDIKEEETVKDSLKSLLELKKPRNCTEEERKGIGLAAIECLWEDMNKPKLRSHILDRIIRLIIIWVCVYLIIAIPCWCQYGWCFCCCRCKFCQPIEQIEDVKQFFIQNPPGTFHDKDDNIIRYTPTQYEKYAQKQLEDQLKKL